MTCVPIIRTVARVPESTGLWSSAIPLFLCLRSADTNNSISTQNRADPGQFEEAGGRGGGGDAPT